MNDERAVIYAILNPSGVIVYIGSTVNYSKRFGKHGFFSGGKNKDHYRKVIDIVPIELRWKMEQSYHELYSKNNPHFVGVKAGSSISSDMVSKIRSAQIGVPKNKKSVEKMANMRKLQCQSGHERDRLLGYNEIRKKRFIDQFGNSYDSIRDCSRRTGVARCEISLRLKTKSTKPVKGYVFTAEYL